jgi:anti-anti-sigma factor
VQGLRYVVGVAGTPDRHDGASECTAANATMSDDAQPVLTVTLERDGAELRIVVGGELDIATVPEVAPHVSAKDAAQAVVLDLGAVTFIDSTGLRLLLEAHVALGDRLRIRPSPACERLFEITGVRDRLPLTDD